MMKREDGAFGSPEHKPNTGNSRIEGAFGTPIRKVKDKSQGDGQSGVSSQQHDTQQPLLPEHMQEQQHLQQSPPAEQSQTSTHNYQEFSGLGICIGFRERPADYEDNYGCDIM